MPCLKRVTIHIPYNGFTIQYDDEFEPFFKALGPQLRDLIFAPLRECIKGYERFGPSRVRSPMDDSPPLWIVAALDHCASLEYLALPYLRGMANLSLGLLHATPPYERRVDLWATPKCIQLSHWKAIRNHNVRLIDNSLASLPSLPRILLHPTKAPAAGGTDVIHYRAHDMHVVETGGTLFRAGTGWEGWLLGLADDNTTHDC